jgi:hypothetical protein
MAVDEATDTTAPLADKTLVVVVVEAATNRRSVMACIFRRCMMFFSLGILSSESRGCLDVDVFFHDLASEDW